MPLPTDGLEGVPQVQFALELLSDARTKFPWIFKSYPVAQQHVSVRPDGRAHIRVIFKVTPDSRARFDPDMADLKRFLYTDSAMSKPPGATNGLSAPVVHLDGYVTKQSEG